MNIRKILTFLLIFSTTFLFSYLYINYDEVVVEKTNHILSSVTESNNKNDIQDEKKLKEENVAVINEDLEKDNKASEENKVSQETPVSKKEENKLNQEISEPKKEEHVEEQVSVSVVEKNTNYDYIKNDNGKIGTAGRLYIPSANLSVAIYNASILADGTYNAQEIVDKIDSAAYYKFGNHYVIADHNYQGFKKIVNLSNNSKAYIKMKDGSIITYKMIRKFTGKNTKIDLINENGKSVNEEDGSLIIYTCYGDDKIMITIWDIDN